MQHLYRATVEVLLDDAERDRLAQLDELGFPPSSKVLYLMTVGRKPYEHQSDPNVHFQYAGVWCPAHTCIREQCHPHLDPRVPEVKDVGLDILDTATQMTGCRACAMSGVGVCEDHLT